MQLYAKCIQLESQKEMFRLFKALGKYINNSGLDQAFTEPEIYRPDGKHMKKFFEANSTLNVALLCMCMEGFVSFHPLMEK